MLDRLTVSITVFTIILGPFGCGHKNEPPRSTHDDLPRFSPPVQAGPQRVIPLTADTLDDFLGWVEVTPRSQVDLIRKKIADGANGPKIVDSLSQRLLQLPVQDVGRRLTILAVIGETRNPQFVEPLKRFIWAKDVGMPLPTSGPKTKPQTSYFRYSQGLQARAAEMLANIATAEAFAAIREIVSGHPEREVRIAAIDAYLFQHQDSEEAKAELARLSPKDAKMIGLPRRTRDMDVQAFDAKVKEFYRRYPEENPPVPQQLHNPPGAAQAVRSRGAAEAIPPADSNRPR